MLVIYVAKLQQNFSRVPQQFLYDFYLHLLQDQDTLRTQAVPKADG